MIILLHNLLGLTVEYPANGSFIFFVLQQNYFPGVDLLLPEQMVDRLLILLLNSLGDLPLIFNLTLEQLLNMFYLVEVEGETLLLKSILVEGNGLL